MIAACCWAAYEHADVVMLLAIPVGVLVILIAIIRAAVQEAPDGFLHKFAAGLSAAFGIVLVLDLAGYYWLGIKDGSIATTMGVITLALIAALGGVQLLALIVAPLPPPPDSRADFKRAFKDWEPKPPPLPEPASRRDPPR
jgi:hypothetical protein